MRFIHTSDWHLGKSLEGHSRIEEQAKFCEEFIKIVESNEIDMVIIAGDVYDTSNPPAQAEKLFYQTVSRLANNGQRCVLIISGNHDNPERLSAITPLAHEQGILIYGYPLSATIEAKYKGFEITYATQGCTKLNINGENIVIATLPYPSEKRLNEVLYGEMDNDEDRLKTYGERIKSLFDGLKKNYREDTINLAVSHLFAMGSEEGGSERSIQLGGSYIVNGSCLPEEAQYIALGHVHKPQVVPGTNKRARYSGSPLHYNKKEINITKKCFIVDIKAKEECKINEVEFKVYKPIEVWKCESIDDAIERCEKNKDRDCWVYLEIKCDRYIREDEIKKMKEIKKDILEIIPKLQNEADDESAISIQEKSFEEIFREFYKKERNVEADEEVVSLLLKLINEEGDENETN